MSLVSLKFDNTSTGEIRRISVDATTFSLAMMKGKVNDMFNVTNYTMKYFDGTLQSLSFFLTLLDVGDLCNICTQEELDCAFEFQQRSQKPFLRLYVEEIRLPPVSLPPTEVNRNIPVVPRCLRSISIPVCVFSAVLFFILRRFCHPLIALIMVVFAGFCMNEYLSEKKKERIEAKKSFRQNVGKLREMGWTDRKKVVQVLQKNKGNLEDAIATLLLADASASAS
jgi:hypothetical protein